MSASGESAETRDSLTHESDESAPKPAKSTPEERLSRIAEAHSKSVIAGGMTGSCNECYLPWPCPTYVWASESGEQRSAALDTWDPVDDGREGW